MQPTYSRDQVDLQEMCRELFARSYPVGAARAARDAPGAPRSDELWSALARSGVLGLAVDEAYGGSGGTIVELGIALREAGRAMAPLDLSTTVQASAAIQLLGSEAQQEEWLPGLAAGRRRAATAKTALALETVPQGRLVTARAEFVRRGGDSDVLVLVGHDGDAVVVDLTTDPVDVAVHDTMDGEDLATIVLDHARVDESRLLEMGGDIALLELWQDAVLALEAMEILGGAEHLLDTTAAYVSTREQFGRPIGTFQAVQHQVADSYIELMVGETQALRALWLVANGRDARVEAAGAAARLATAYVDVSIRAHQLHGGMGFARESQLYLWSERAKASQVLLDPAALQRRVAAHATGPWNPWRAGL